MFKKRVFLVFVGMSLFFTGCEFNQIVKEGKVSEHTPREEEFVKKPETNLEEEIPSTEEVKPIEEIISKMSLEEKIGQLFIINLPQDEKGQGLLLMNEELKEMITQYKVGGIILFKGNIETKEQTKKLIKDLQGLSTIPLFIGVDEEGGLVSRIGNNPELVEEPFRAAFDMGQAGDLGAAYEEAQRMGGVLSELGFNLNFAPVADIYNNPSNTVIGKRSFGTTKEQVTPMVISYAKGLLACNIQPVLKHFPGHGNTYEDSHEGLAYIQKSQKELEAEELAPFLEAVNEGIDVVMTGHLIVKDIDATYPVTLSDKWFLYMETLFDTNKILFITDAMNMGAVVNEYTQEEALMKSFLAGNDILLMPEDITQAAEILKHAYKEGIITEERLDQSVGKILSKKVERNILVLE